MLLHRPLGVRLIDNYAAGYPGINPATALSWAVLLDARRITGVTNGATFAVWPDTSGNGRNTSHLIADPVYRATGSPSGRPTVDFTGGKDLHGALPAIALDTTAGVTILAYVQQDTVDANDGGGFNAQSIFGCYIGTNCRLYGVIYPTANSPQVGGRTSGAGDQGSGTAATTGAHTLALVANPPSGAGGSVRIYKDGVDIGGWSNWSIAPQTEYIISGNGGNIRVKGKVCWVGLACQAATPAQITGMHTYLRAVFG
jgi:hypothetical protein